jgi:hypothetical protein
MKPTSRLGVTQAKVKTVLALTASRTSSPARSRNRSRLSQAVGTAMLDEAPAAVSLARRYHPDRAASFILLLRISPFGMIRGDMRAEREQMTIGCAHTRTLHGINLADGDRCGRP